MDDSERRALGGQALQKSVQSIARTFDLDEHSTRIVQYPTAKLEFGRQPVNKGAEPDALHRPVNLDAQPAGGHIAWLRRRGGCHVRLLGAIGRWMALSQHSVPGFVAH